ncbi:MAG: capsular polysaccharide biosynthesis protein [Lachnospiraceae bacterium]|nr:capsular polysaccharide biosynthesis protein [Lachnospiraceae bacterium]
MDVIDFHSHVLPGIDDGSRNLDTTAGMLGMCYDNGVKMMIATPHFYAEHDRIEVFLERRQKAYEQVMSLQLERSPKLRLGAEVAYFKGISKAEKIPLLTIQDTDIMLLEMPFYTWDKSVITEVKELIEKRHLRLIIAHLERYIKLSGNKSAVADLLELPVIIQINAGSLLDWKQRGALLKLFKTGKAQLLGSDCHGMNHRPPNLWLGREVIKKKLGDDVLKKIDEVGNGLF